MKSSIKLDLNPEGSPIINVNLVDSDDIRDKLLSRFIEKAVTHEKRWLYIQPLLWNVLNLNAYEISPIPENALKQEGETMILIQNYIEGKTDFNENFEQLIPPTVFPELSLSQKIAELVKFYQQNKK